MTFHSEKVAPFKPTNQQIIDAYHEHGSFAGAARALTDQGLPIGESSIRRRANRGVLGTAPVIPGFSIKQVSTQRGPDGETQKEWIKQGPESGEAFAVAPGQIIRGVSALVDASGKVQQQWIKTKLSDDLALAAIREAFDTYSGRCEPIPPPDLTDDALLSIYPIADQHNGLRSWGPETGENYDLKIGADRLRATSQRLIAQSPASRQAIILNLGDWTHADDAKNMTPGHGHILDVDGRYFKIMCASVRLMQDVIELALQKHEAVTVRNLPGNHDPHTCFALTIALMAFYANNPRVIIDDDPGEFFFHRFGSTLIGANHGHRMKADKMAMNMAVRRRADWGETKYHYFYFGHIHHESAKEIGDVRVESFQTLAAKDAYAANAGYMAGQSLTSITIHREDGEIGRHRVNIPPIVQRPSDSMAA